mgnify:CR=1 FL=1
MSAAFEQAWLFLKFQPSQGYPIGEGANQIVYGKEGDPNVTKVGGAFNIGDYYQNELLRPMAPFSGQVLIPTTEELPMEAQARFGGRSPVLSQQIRGVPFPDTKSHKEHMADSRANMVQAYDQPGYGALLEAMGVADLKRPNFMRVAGYDKPVIHDPAFYGPENPPKSTNEGMNAYMARGDPRRLGTDYTVPDELTESLARRVDELPYEEYVQPALDSEIPMSTAEQEQLQQMIDEQGKEVKSNLGKIGVF